MMPKHARSARSYPNSRSRENANYSSCPPTKILLTQESAPLINKPHSAHPFARLLWLHAITFLVVVFLAFYAEQRSYLSPSVRASIRQKWRVELEEHRRQWISERSLEEQRRMSLRKLWEHEWNVELEEHEALRSDWEHERAIDIEQHESLRRQWEHERAIEIEQHESLRRQWEHERAIEIEQHESLRRQWGHERAQWDEERKEWERRHEEKEREEERKRANVRFDSPQPLDHCKSFGTREYSSKILNVPDSLDGMQACIETSAEIHNVLLKPNRCEDRGKWNGIWGHWTVDFHEPLCSPSFDNVQDKGCGNQGGGMRIFHAHLGGLQESDDWRVMCSTTPASFAEHHFDSPTRCEEWGKYGVWGIFEVPDNSC